MPLADFVCFRCMESDPDNAGPFLDLPLKAKKPKCPNCGASKWMQRQWSGYRIGVSVKGGAEALPRMDHDAVKRTDHLVEAAMQRQQPVSRRFEVAHGYDVKAVPVGNMGQEVGRLAAATAGEQAGAMTAAAVQSSLKIGKSRADHGEVRKAETTIDPPRRRTEVVGRWTPTERDIAAAGGAR